MNGCDKVPGMRRADRLFHLVQLIRGRRLTTAEFLAQRLEVSARTVYRDIADLQHQGVPIEGEAGVGYRLGASKGTSIRSAKAGTVKTVVYGSTGYGYYLTIDHGGGLVTLYGHCSEILVREGQTVKAGETVAKVGSTGRSTGNHLHFEVRANGVKQNPRSYLP